MSIGIGNFDVMFSIMPIFMGLFFLVIISIFIIAIAKGIKQWSYNNAQPILAVMANIVSKREKISSSSHHDTGDFNHHHSHTSTSYYVTFEVESGSRMELQVDGSQYGLIAEGDSGKLTFQGTRYLGFQRGKRD